MARLYMYDQKLCLGQVLNRVVMNSIKVVHETLDGILNTMLLLHLQFSLSHPPGASLSTMALSQPASFARRIIKSTHAQRLSA
ncbi:unnamed protein product [Allacma fusca]|uniref:Uncharacterized protein n=1 Tax=Allacma fusca TaxID=39272 RepID=A0A8J2NUX7_9HEXA|nr:unnamed protein product [Allacma fusca]